MKIKDITSKIFKHQNLNFKESEFLFKCIFDDKLNSDQISSILSIITFRGETFEEIYGAINFLKSKSKKLSLKGSLIDTCGTGGDNKKSFNFSTATAILLSACGLSVAKHGNRSVTSKSGSVDVIEALNIKIHESVSNIKKMSRNCNICFLFAPHFHKSLKKVAQIRKNIGFRTIFNLLGPLLNPAKIDYQLLGVTNKEFLKTHSACLSKMDLTESWVVHNLDGYDELTTTNTNLIIKVKKKKISKVLRINAKDLGLTSCKQDELLGGDSKENAFIMHRLFDGETGPIRDNVLLNTSACLLITGKVKTLEEGKKYAENVIDSFKARDKLKQIINYSNGL